MVALQSTVYFVATAVGWAALQSSDRRWGDTQPSFRAALVSGVLFAAWMTGATLYRVVAQRQKARRAIGPRFDTDRRALAQALKTGELPVDPTLNGPLLSAISFRRNRSRGEDDVPPWVGWLIVAVALPYVVWLLGWPWVLVLLLPLLIRLLRWRLRTIVDIDELRLAAQRRMGIEPGDPGVLTYDDLQG
jgi:hypothetical protein